MFEELGEHHRLEFIRERPDAQVAAVVSRMAADDAADLIVEIEQDRRGRILALLPATHRRQIESLLGYNPSTAGGLMSPEFVLGGETDTVAHALDAVRSSDHLAPGTLTTVYLRDAEGRVCRARCAGDSGSCAPIRRVSLREIAEHEPVSVRVDADLPEVARTMTDYNLVMLAVVDEDGRMVGVVTVDDVLELTLPAGWRRRFGVVRD